MCQLLCMNDACAVCESCVQSRLFGYNMVRDGATVKRHEWRSNGPTGPATCPLQRWHLDDINHGDKKLTLAGHLVNVQIQSRQLQSYEDKQSATQQSVWTCRIWSSYCLKYISTVSGIVMQSLRSGLNQLHTGFWVFTVHANNKDLIYSSDFASDGVLATCCFKLRCVASLLATNWSVCTVLF